MAVLIPLVVGFTVRAWLYGLPGRNQRLSAAPSRRRIVAGAALVTTTALTVAFFARGQWTSAVGEQTAISLFLGAVLVLVGLLYAMLPPQRDL